MKAPLAGEGESASVNYGDTESVLLKFKTDNLLDDFESSELISSQIDYINWDESIHPELRKR